MEKAKRKHDNLQEQTGWFTPAVLDFVTDLTLDECAVRLQSLERSGFFVHPKVRVTLTALDADTYEFYIQRTGNKYPKNEAKGYLQRWEGTATRVTGEAWIGSSNFWGLIFVIPMLCFFFAVMAPKMLGLAFVYVLIMSAGIVYALYENDRKPRELAALIEDTLIR